MWKAFLLMSMVRGVCVVLAIMEAFVQQLMGSEGAGVQRLLCIMTRSLKGARKFVITDKMLVWLLVARDRLAYVLKGGMIKDKDIQSKNRC